MLPEPTPAMHRDSPSRRGFRTADALILVVATATGLALSSWVEVLNVAIGSRTRPSLPGWTRSQVLGDPGSWLDLTSIWSEFALRLVNLSVPLLATLSLALIPIRLLPPHPRRWRLARLPGTAATCATVVAFLYIGTFYVIVRLVLKKVDLMQAYEVAYVVTCAPVLVGLSIVSAWTTLLIARRWRAEPTWIDRLGRIVAAAWIAAGLFTTGHYLVYRFLGFSASMMSY